MSVSPHLGDARRPFRSHYKGTIGQNSQSLSFSTREAAFLPVGIAPSGFEVLVNYALNSIELTNQFLLFPRVRQQTRGNISFQCLQLIFVVGGIARGPRGGL